MVIRLNSLIPKPLTLVCKGEFSMLKHYMYLNFLGSAYKYLKYIGIFLEALVEYKYMQTAMEVVGLLGPGAG